MKIRVSTHALARDTGKPSSDACHWLQWEQSMMAVLCDGAGTGEPAREAALRVVDSLIEYYRARPRDWSSEHALLQFTQLLNTTLYEESQARFGRSEMVTTLAAAVIEGEQLTVINLGDSRILLYRAGELRQLSVDDADEVQRNLLTQAVGIEPAVSPHVLSMEVEEGDVVLLCSDGFSNQVPPVELTAALQQKASAHSLISQARKAASAESLDDMTLLMMEVKQTGKLRAMRERNLSIPTELHAGLKLDGFELIRHFQGTDRVWLVQKEGLRYVLKLAPTEAVDSALHLDAFTRETWNATRASSEHFVRSFEPLGQTARYYVMEFIDAPSLASVLHERILSVDSAVSLGNFLADACQTLLRLDLAHGDIKPENLLCVGDYAKLSFKLLDLGTAAPPFSVSSRAGTASYLAPERFHSAPVSECTELFAIGVTLYQALTRQLPYGHIERFQTPHFSPAKRVSALNPNVPPWLDAIVAKAIALDAKRRYQSFSELAFDLKHPQQVQPFFAERAPLLERNPLGFYKTGFFILLLLSMYLLLLLLHG